MSYCRWSSDNCMCDVYAYQDTGGGWTTHVRSARYVDVPKLPPYPEQGGEVGFHAWCKAHKDQLDFLRTAKIEAINLPYDGQSFNDGTLEEFHERMIMLKNAGYNVPDYVLITIEDEIKEAERTQ